MKKSRSLRRHHYARLKSKVVSQTYFGHSKNDWRCALENKIGFYANTAKCTSSALSSNPRNNKWNSKKHQITLQERRSEFDAKEFNY